MVIEGKGKATTTSRQSQPNRPSPVSRIGKIASLRKFADTAQALDLLHDLAKAVAPIINEHRFQVGLLSEMDPKNPNLLGLNVNHGQKVLIRLRPAYNKSTFLPMGDLIGTFLHELCHNVHGPHNAAFYSLLDSLKTQYETASYNSQYFAEENKLGTGLRDGMLVALRVRDMRLKKLSGGIFKAEKRRLGGAVIPIANRRAAMLEAAERRMKDSQWCTEAVASDIPKGDELEVEDCIDLTGDAFVENSTEDRTESVRVKPNEKKEIEVIDLTDE